MSESRGIPEQEGQRIIHEGHRKRFRNCYREAWRRWNEEMPAKVRKDLCARSRATIIYDFVANQALIEFDGADGVTIVDPRDNGGYLSLVFEDTVVARLKKFRDDGLSTCGITTREQKRFAFQEPPLLGFPTIGNLVVGYVLDKLESSYSTLAIASLVDDQLQWSIDITEPEAGQGDLPRPIRDGGPSEPTIRSASDEQRDTEQATQSN